MVVYGKSTQDRSICANEKQSILQQDYKIIQNVLKRTLPSNSLANNYIVYVLIVMLNENRLAAVSIFENQFPVKKTSYR